VNSPHSPIKVTKISFQGKISAGLECTRPISAGTYILTAGGSMSSDNVYGGGLSVITRSTGQLGPGGERLILGPLRFANHECEPNCQVSILIFFVIYMLLRLIVRLQPLKTLMHMSFSLSTTFPQESPSQCHIQRMDTMNQIKSVYAAPASQMTHLCVLQSAQ
jgi:hypothetical protein